jgi:competence protein ComEC
MFSYQDYSVKRHSRETIIFLLIISNIVVWVLVSQHREGKLKVSFLDIGQGDAIFVETPSHKHLLLDGGPNKKVLTEIGKLMPFGTKRIDIMIESHPDKDHIGGLPEVVSRYDVGVFLEPGVESENSIDDELHKRFTDKSVQTLLARRGQVINFGDGVKLIILFPNQDVSKWETNDASIVAKLVYGEESFLLTGDSTMKAENILMSLDKKILNSEVLKAGHHGSKTSTSLAYAQAVSPTYAIISAGKDNSYGHPHQVTLDTLNKIGAQILSTIDLGTITFETDGQTMKVD